MELIQNPPSPYTGQQTFLFDPILAPAPTTQTQTGNIFDSIGNVIDKVVTGISTVTGAVTGAVSQVGTTTQQTATGIKTTFGDTASDIGSDSITKSLKENLPYIIIGLAAFTLIIVLAIYASKRK